ncbi:hypothetical protein ACT453_35625, partial [Bacillus sp. D-CC]
MSLKRFSLCTLKQLIIAPPFKFCSLNVFKVHNENLFKEIPHLKDGYDHFFRRIFNSLDIMHNLEELKIHTSEKYKFQFQYRSAVMLDGSIAFQIIRGGAYKCFPDRMVMAKQLA